VHAKKDRDDDLSINKRSRYGYKRKISINKRRKEKYFIYADLE
jgi:hypothetical protein